MDSSGPPSGSTSRLAFPGAILVGKYRLESVVGEGGMGSVWAATHLGLNQQIAIKLVSRAFVRSPEALKRFDNEAKAAAQIKSRHVAQVYDNGVLEDGTPYLAMELLYGETLFNRVHRGGPVSLLEGVMIIDHCCRALARAHSFGIVHRDIKPENIFLAHSVDDDNYVVKVLDFGIAKMTALDAGEQSTTRTGSLLGTPMYMSPEQARGLRTIDYRSDLYSLGVVSYMMFTGNVAFGGDTLGELLLQICAQPLPSLIAGARWLPPPMEGWFQKVCAREPAQRYQSAQALVEGVRLAAGMSTPGDGPGSLVPQQTPQPVSHTGGVSQPQASWAGQSTTGAATVEPAAGVPGASGKKGLIVAGIASAVVGIAITVAGTLLVTSRHSDSKPVVESVEPSAASSGSPTAVASAAPSAALTSIPTAPANVEPAPSATPTAGATPSHHSHQSSGAIITVAPAHPTKPTPAPPGNPPPPSKPGNVDLGY